MGTIRELSSGDKHVHMLITNSNLAEIYVYDILKVKCRADSESIYRIEKATDFKEMFELVGMQPYLADKWLFIINYSKLKSNVKNKIGILESETACFLITVKNYADYKEFKQLYPRVNDMYLSFMRESEIGYLLHPFGLSQKSIEFVARSYGRDPDRVFELLKELKNGAKIETQKDIVNICGASAGSIAHFAVSLLSDPPSTDKGGRTVIRNRIKEAEDLIDAYGMKTFRNFLVSTVKDILDIKTLYMEGVIYKSIRDIPECYDEKRLSKYNYYFRRITEEIPYGRLVRLYVELRQQGAWYSKAQMLQFIYNYYGGCVDGITG